MSELNNILTEILRDKNENLKPENLNKQISCLGVDGTLIPETSDATATADDILEGKTACVKEELIIGAMPDNGELIYIPSDEEQSIPKGYNSGITINAIDITKLQDYTTCLDISKQILPGLELKPYIEYRDKTSYTDLEITPNNQYKYEIYFDDSDCELGTDVTLFGSWASDAGLMFGIQKTVYHTADNSGWKNTSQSYNPGQHKLVISNELGYVLDDIKIQNANIKSNNLSLWLNKANFYNGTGFNGKIFEFIVYNETDEIIFDAIPDKSGTFKDKIANKLLSTSGKAVYGYDNWIGGIK